MFFASSEFLHDKVFPVASRQIGRLLWVSEISLYGISTVFEWYFSFIKKTDLI